MNSAIYTPAKSGIKLRRIASFGTTSMLAAASQGLGLVQIAILLWFVSAGTETDSYFFLASWSQVPVQILLLGTVYPMWLRGAEHSRSAMAVWIISVPTVSCTSTVLAGMIFANVSDNYEGLFFNTVLMAALGIVSSVCWACVLKLSAEGRPNWFSAITLCANVCSCLTLIFLQPSNPSWAVTLMISAQLCGMSFYLLLIVRFNGKVLSSLIQGRSLASQKNAAVTGSPWFFSQAAVSYGAGLVLQTLAASLPASSLSTVSIVGRVVSGLSSVATNAVLPRLVHKDSQDGARAYIYVWASTVLAALAAAIIFGLDSIFELTVFGTAAIVVSWYAAAALNATVHRVATRFNSPRLSLITIVVSIAVPSIVFITSQTSSISLVFILAAYVTLDLGSGMLFAFRMKQWILALAVACVSAASFFGGVLVLG